MRKTSFTNLFIALFSFALFSCTKHAESPASTTNTTSSTAAIVTSGAWTISSNTQRTDNNTSKFSGITFTFSADGILAASGTNSATGTWSSTDPSAGYYGGPASLATFTINLGTSAPFNKINKSWIVVEQTATTLRLDNKEPLEDEHLVFSKK